MTTQEKLETFMNIVKDSVVKTECPFKLEDMFIAGGCIRSLTELEEIKDIDIFFRKNVEADKVKAYFKEYLPDSFITENAVSITLEGMKYQFVLTQQGEPLEIVNEFDFTMNMNYFDFHNKQTYIHDLTSIVTKRLKINLKCRNKLSTLARIHKFVERGYKIPSRLNLIELGVQLTQQKSVVKFEELQESSKLYFSRSDYDNISTVDNSNSYDDIIRNYKGSAV